MKPQIRVHFGTALNASLDRIARIVVEAETRDRIYQAAIVAGEMMFSHPDSSAPYAQAVRDFATRHEAYMREAISNANNGEVRPEDFWKIKDAAAEYNAS